MDRRRLEEGFLLLASIEALQKHNLPLSNLPSDKNTMIELVTKEYSEPEAFVKKWGGMYMHLIPYIIVVHYFPFFVL